MRIPTVGDTAALSFYDFVSEVVQYHFYILLAKMSHGPVQIEGERIYAKV